MATRVDMTTLADELVDILENIQRTGEQYDIERDGEVITSITPAKAVKAARLSDLARVLATVPRPDDQFADDLEAVKRSQPPMDPIPWDI